MQIHYQLTIEDVLAFNQYHFRTSKRLRRSYYLSQVWMILGALAAAILWSKRGVSFRLLEFLIVSVVLVIFYRLYYAWWISHSAKRLFTEGKNKGVLGNHIFAIDADGILEISDVGETRTVWSGVERIEENDEYMFLYVGSFHAHIIPKRAFMSENEASRFFQLAQAYHTENLRLID